MFYNKHISMRHVFPRSELNLLVLTLLIVSSLGYFPIMSSVLLQQEMSVFVTPTAAVIHIK